MVGINGIPVVLRHVLLLGAVQPTRVIVPNYLERRNLLAKTGRCAPTTAATTAAAATAATAAYGAQVKRTNCGGECS